MDLLSRYRNVTVLLVVIFAQLVLLGYQVKSGQDVRLIRVWAVTAVTPMANVIETVRSGTVDSLGNYISLHDLAGENKQLKRDLSKLKLDNQYLKSELQSADRAVALTAFEAHSPSKMVAARVIATGTGASANSRVVFIDRGSGGGVMRGVAVITPDGIVGKLLAAYPTASQVLLITDPTFAAGVISQKHHVRGTVRGLGHSTCMVDYVQNEEQVDQGEWFYTSGDDGVFPKGLPVGYVTVARQGSPNKEIHLAPSGLQAGLEEVLIITEGVHQPIPEAPTPATAVHLQAPPPETTSAPQNAAGEPVMTTEADRLRARYKKIGEAESHRFGDNPPGAKAPNFNLTPEDVAARAAKAAAAAQAPKPPAGAPAGAGAVASPEAPKPAAPKQNPQTVRPPSTGPKLAAPPAANP
jgi:rod shape-determining protein MreC